MCDTYSLSVLASHLAQMSRPSLAGWWKCSACGSLNNPKLSNGGCTCCNHTRCRDCFSYGGLSYLGGGPSYSVPKVEPKNAPDAVNPRRSLPLRHREPRGRQKDEPSPGRLPDKTPQPRPTAVVGRKLSPWGKVKRACCKLTEPSVPFGAR